MQFLDRVKFGSGKSGSPAVSGVINSYASCSGSIGSNTLTTSLSVVDGDVVLIHQTQGSGAGQWELNVAKADNGATIEVYYPLTYTYSTGAQIVLVPQYMDGDLSGAVTCTAWNGSYGGIVALMCKGDLTISGSISVNQCGFRGGSNSHPKPQKGFQGEGSPGAGIQMTSSGVANGNGGGSITNGGAAVGNAALTSMLFGGGGASAQNYGNTNVAGYGGKGGGIIVIIAKTITLTGTLSSNGQGGGVGNVAGGGGAGGSILLKCQSATLGTNKITVTAGPAGTYQSGNDGGGDTGAGGGNASQGGSGGTGTSNGGAGSVGRIHLDYLVSFSGSATPTVDTAQDTNLRSQIYTSMI